MELTKWYARRDSNSRPSEWHEEALTTCDRAIELDPTADHSWIVKGTALMNLERYEEALIAFENAIELKPDNDLALYNMACGFSLMGEKEKSLSALSRAIEFDPLNKEMARSQEAFKSLHSDPDFIKLVE